MKELPLKFSFINTNISIMQSNTLLYRGEIIKSEKQNSVLTYSLSMYEDAPPVSYKLSDVTSLMFLLPDNNQEQIFMILEKSNGKFYYQLLSDSAINLFDTITPYRLTEFENEDFLENAVNQQFFPYDSTYIKQTFLSTNFLNEENFFADSDAFSDNDPYSRGFFPINFQDQYVEIQIYNTPDEQDARKNVATLSAISFNLFEIYVKTTPSPWGGPDTIETDEDEFTNYSRPSRIKLSFANNYNAGLSYTRALYSNEAVFELEDLPGNQTFILDNPAPANSIKMEILNIYPGLNFKPALSEITFYYCR